MSTERRVTVGINAPAAEDLDWLIANTNLTQTELVNRSLRLLKLYQENYRDGGKLILGRTDGTQDTILIL